MIDWQWIPGAVIGAGALGHSLRLRYRFDTEVKAKALELQRQVTDQMMHGLQLWPRPWAGGGRILTQVEEIVTEPYGFKGLPLPPEEQLKQMRADAQRLLDSYQPPGGETDDA
jgi:hypothetical protein